MMYKNPEWSYSAVLYELNVRQFTEEGTFRAARRRLPFLRQLGVDAIWLMPIYPIGVDGRKGSLGSYYSIRDYKAVNSEFGTESDLRDFIAAAHGLGMRILLDWVANHTARDARWIDERPMDWYERDEQGVALVPWDWSDTAKLNYANHDVWRGQIEAMRYWVEEFGVDGFRCDMAMLVPIEFWQQASEVLHAIKSDIFMLAEAEELNLFDRAFDMCYAWEIHHTMCDIAKGARRVWDLRNMMYADRERYPHEAIKMMFTSNHDENSWAGTEFERMGDAAKVMAVLTFTLPNGQPLIYTGQEIGWNKRFEFFQHDPVTSWEENEYTDFYKELISIRHANPALAAGDKGGKFEVVSAEDSVLVFTRTLPDNKVTVKVELKAPWSYEITAE